MLVYLPVLPSFDVLGLAAFETLKISFPALAHSARGTLTAAKCNQLLDSWSRNLVKHAQIELHVRGRELISPAESYIVMSNHQSHFDIPVLYQSLKLPLRMVAKKELYRIPIMSQAMRVAGFVEVDRRDRQKAIESLRAIGNQLSEKLSIWIAPEGTRTKTGHLNEFKKGGFYMALDAGLRVLPVSISGTRNVLPANGLHVTRGQRVEVVVSPPIDTLSFGAERRVELMAQVRAAINANLWPEYRRDPSAPAAPEEPLRASGAP